MFCRQSRRNGGGGIGVVGSFKEIQQNVDDALRSQGVPLPEDSGATQRDIHIPMEPILNEGVIGAAQLVSKGEVIIFELTGLRKERTGLHGRLAILRNKTCLAWNQMNIERDEDRTRLANKAHKMLDTITREFYPAEILRYDLDHFCLKAWDALLDQEAPVALEGDATIPTYFLLHPYIIKGGGTILFAPPGRGKSYTALLMAVSIDANNGKVFQGVSSGKVLFINLERSQASIQRRIGMINNVLGLEPHRSLLCLNARGKSLADVYEIARRFVENEKVDIVFLDSISRSGQGSLLDDRSVNATIDLLNNLSETWFAVGHSPRADDSHIFGSVHFEAGADVLVRQQTEKTDSALGIGLEITKENDIGPTRKQLWAYEFDKTGLINVRHAKENEFVEMEMEGETTLGKIRAYLNMHGRGTANEIAADIEVNRTTVVTYLSNKPEIFLKLSRSGKKQEYVIRAEGELDEVF